MEKKCNRKIARILLITFLLYYMPRSLAPYDILINVHRGERFLELPTYYELSITWGVRRKIHSIPDDYLLSRTAEHSSNNEEIKAKLEQLVDNTEYSYIKQYDPLMNYDGNNRMVSCINECVYYLRTGDTQHYYRYTQDTREIKQIPLASLNRLIMGDDTRIISGKPYPDTSVPFIDESRISYLENLAIFDYYEGLNEAMLMYVDPVVEYSPGKFYVRRYEADLVAGRVFFHAYGKIFDKLYEFYPESKTAECIARIPSGYRRWNWKVIGVA